jgi:hypothetical protein
MHTIEVDSKRRIRFSDSELLIARIVYVYTRRLRRLSPHVYTTKWRIQKSSLGGGGAQGVGFAEGLGREHVLTPEKLNVSLEMVRCGAL